MSDQETDAAVSDEDTDADLNDVQAWNEATGQEPPQTTTSDSEDDTHDAAADQEAEEHAEEASSDAEEGGDGHEPAKQHDDPNAEIKRLRGQVGGKDRKIRELQQKIAEERKARQESQTKGPDPKDLDDLRESYPDLVNPILQRLEDIQNRLDRTDQSVDRFAELHEASMNADFAAETQVFRQLRPDGTKVVSDNPDAFWEWVEDQPRKDRDLAYASQKAIQDGEAMADLLGRFDAHLGASTAPKEPGSKEPPQKRGTSTTSNARLAGAQTVSSTGGRPATSKPNSAETDEIAAWNYVTRE